MLSIGDQNIFIHYTGASRTLVRTMRKHLPAFTLTFDGNKRLGNPRGDHGGIHGQTNVGIPIHRTFILKIFRLRDMLKRCPVSETFGLKQFRSTATEFTL